MKTPQERGYEIPVMRELGPGRYQKGWARSLDPVKGRILICFDSGRRSSWDPAVTIHVPQGFNLYEKPEPQEPVIDDALGECYECGRTFLLAEMISHEAGELCQSCIEHPKFDY